MTFPVGKNARNWRHLNLFFILLCSLELNLRPCPMTTWNGEDFSVTQSIIGGKGKNMF